MLKYKGALIALALAGAYTSVSHGEANAQQQAAPQPPPVQPPYGLSIGGSLAAFEPFIGGWSPDGAADQNPMIAEFYGELYEWGPRGNIVRLYEFAHRTNRQRGVLEGIIFWHPVNERFEFSAYNAAQLFSFEGVYEVTPEQMTRTMTVTYPDGFADPAYPEAPARQRTYREVRRLTAPDAIELTIELKVGDQWRRWPNESAPPVLLRRVAIDGLRQ